MKKTLARGSLWQTHVCLVLAASIVLLFSALRAKGQAGVIKTREPAPYTPQIWDIDWSYLRDPTLAEDWTDELHFIRLGESSKNLLSVTGQIRERGEYQDYPAFGAQPADNGYLLQRYLASGDLHLGSHFRTFIQLDSGIENGRDGGPRPGIDEDKLDFNQGFIDLSLGESAERSLTIRSGRQLVSLGSTRLVAIGAGLNVEQPFDGFRLTLRTKGWTAEGLALRPTLVKTGYFDNAPNSTEELWGLNLTRMSTFFQESFSSKAHPVIV